MRCAHTRHGGSGKNGASQRYIPERAGDAALSQRRVLLWNFVGSIFVSSIFVSSIFAS